MKEYYILKNQTKEGPYSLEELKVQNIFPHSIIIKQGWENPRTAFKVLELSSLFEKRSTKTATQNISAAPTMSGPECLIEPIIENERVQDIRKIDYSKVEDIAGVDYKKAAIISLCYVIANVFLSEFMLTTRLGLLLNGGIPFVIWWYFKKFFISLNDRDTAKFVNWVYAGYAVFAPLLLYTLFNGWDEMLGRTIGEFLVNIFIGIFTDNHDANTTELEGLVFVSKFVFYSFLLIIIFLWVAGIKILTVNKRYDFPLKRIAFSTMIFIPIHMFYLLGHAVVNKIPDSFMMNAIAMIPYILLAMHFYQADTEDATPG